MKGSRAVDKSDSRWTWWGVVAVSTLYFAVIDFAWVAITIVNGPLS